MNTTLPRMVFDRARHFNDRTALRYRDQGSYKDISWSQMADKVQLFARGLLALGVRRGDRIGIMAPNSPEWVYADLGAMTCGAVSVPVYHTEGFSSIRHIVEDSQCRILFVCSPLVARKLAAKRSDTPHLEHIVLLHPGAKSEGITGYEAFTRAAEQLRDADLAPHLEKGAESDLATLVYTSGTTGPPKGVMLTHGNILSNIDACAPLFDITGKDQCLSFLPLSHVFERMAGYYLMQHCGAVIAYAEDLDSVPANLVEVRPTIVISVPRLYEKMYAGVMERVLAGPWIRKQVFFGALKFCRAFSVDHAPSGLLEEAQQKVVGLVQKTIFAPLRERLGGNLRFFVSGGAPLSREIAEFFLAAGVPIYEGYGLTETSPVVAVNTPAALRPGTVGRPVPGTEVRIAEDGEIVVCGPGVFQGYWNRPQQTAEVLEDGWFKTGDIGEIDAGGFLAITDRKKDLIVTASGENIAPQVIENHLKTNKYVANAMVYGDRKPFLTALLVPNLETLEQYASLQKIDFLTPCDLVSHPKILELMREEVNRLQAQLPSFQRIKRFTLLSQDFSTKELTPTLKLKRKLVTRHFNEILEGMYIAQDHGIHDNAFCIVEDLDEKEKD